MLVSSLVSGGDEAVAALLVLMISPQRPFFVYDSTKEQLFKIVWAHQRGDAEPLVLWYSRDHYDV